MHAKGILRERNLHLELPAAPSSPLAGRIRRRTATRAIPAIPAMLAPIAALLLTGIGCKQTKSCAPNTVVVSFNFSGAATNASSLTLETSIDGVSSAMPGHIPHQPGVKTGSVELTLQNYKQGATFELTVTPADASGMLAEPTSKTILLLSGCTTLTFNWDAPNPDGGAPDRDSGDTVDTASGSGGGGISSPDGSGGAGGLGGTDGGGASGGSAADVGSGGVMGTGGGPGTGGGVGTGGAGTGGTGTGGTGTGGTGTGGTGTGGTGTGGTGTGGAQCTPPAMNACSPGATQCVSATTLQTCGTANNGCTANVTSTCAANLVCERHAPADCVDPTWAEWPMPNDPVDVLAGAPNPQAYLDNGDGTITDNVTALMWQKEVAPGTFTWDQAVMYCRVTLNTAGLAGHQDWRLPSRIELVSILDVGVNPAINTLFFPMPPLAVAFWSASEVVGSPSTAWYVPFDYGGAYDLDKSSNSNVRCVR